MRRKELVRKAEPPSKVGKIWRRWTGLYGMTLRDWLPIVGSLLIPVVIAAGGWRIASQQGKVEDQRAQAERKLAEQRAQDEALQSYLNQMGGLLLEKDLRESKKDSEVRILARARTLTVLGKLDQSRKTALMQFLVEADLVQRVDGRDPIISLRDAELRSAHLSFADLRGADLRRVVLSGAFLGEAKLVGAELVGADLRDADLYGAMRWTAKQLTAARSLKGATMPDGQILKSADNPDGPTFEEWLKSKGRTADGENE